MINSKNEKMYCFFIISCKKNIKVLDIMLNSLCKNLSEDVNIYVSFDEEVNYFYSDARVYIKWPECDKINNFGDRILNALKSINEKYVIVMCDDFVVEKTINQKIINDLIQEMENDPIISSVSLASTSGKRTQNKIFDQYVQKTKYSDFCTTLQCTLWNKKAFQKLINGAKSPWEFEVFSNYKVFCSKNKFYTLEDDNNQPIVYNRGNFVIRGKVVEPEKQRLERILNQSIKLDDFESTYSYVQPSNLSIIGKIHRRIKMAVYFFLYYLKSLYINYDLNQ